MKKRFSIISMLTLVLIASALTCAITWFFMVRQNHEDDDITAAVLEYAALLETIDRVYIGHFDVEEVSAEAMRGAVDALGDRWSYYMTPAEYARFLDRARNRYPGIGVGVDTTVYTEGIKVIFVYKGSAAETAGIIAGDIITGVDGEDIAGTDVNGLRDLLARPIGDTITLRIKREDGTTHELKVVYSYIFIDPVSFELLDGNVGYIRLENFDEGAADRFILAANELIEQGAIAFVYDVRLNGGGRVSEMTKILDYLLPEGEIFVTVDKSGSETITRSGPEMIDLPAVVLVDKNSYSAAEYFAALLSEYDYAQTVGEQTTGKSRMQITLELPGGGALHISSSQYLTKNRVSLHDIGGLTPDHIVTLTDEQAALFAAGELAKEDDTQLQKALLLLPPLK